MVKFWCEFFINSKNAYIIVFDVDMKLNINLRRYYNWFCYSQRIWNWVKEKGFLCKYLCFFVWLISWIDNFGDNIFWGLVKIICWIFLIHMWLDCDPTSGIDLVGVFLYKLRWFTSLVISNQVAKDWAHVFPFY